MTPEELDAILALNRIEPVLHEEREDMRVKFMTAAMINSMWGGSIEPYQLDYLGRDSETVEVSEEATKQNVIQEDLPGVGTRRSNCGAGSCDVSRPHAAARWCSFRSEPAGWHLRGEHIHLR